MTKHAKQDPQDPPAARGAQVLRSRTALAILSFVVGSLALYAGSRWYRGESVSLPTPQYFPSPRERVGRTGPLPRAAANRHRPPERIVTTVQPIEAPEGTEPLARFFRSLARTARKEPGAITRITHFGDSQIVADHITSTVRRELQQRFGDAGHGFIWVGRSRESYRHLGIKHWSRGWKFAGVVRPRFRDRHYGLAGIHAYATGPGPIARFTTPDSGPVGQRVSRFEVAYHVDPRGGRFSVSVDGERRATINTRDDPRGPPAGTAPTPSRPPTSPPSPARPGGGPRTRPTPGNVEDKDARKRSQALPPGGVYRLRVKDGAHRFTVRSQGHGVVRLFGVVLERDVPGVVYDSLGLLGAQMRDLVRNDEAHFIRQLRWRRPDLVVLGYGTNEADQKIPVSDYQADWKALLGRVREALPEVSCLVLGPVDKVHRRGSHPRIPPLTRAMKKLAFASGCAFWNTLEAMGGKGAAVRWRKAGLYWGDLAHLNPKGGEKMGGLLSTALLERYQGFKARRAAKRRRRAPATRETGKEKKGVE